MSAPSLAQETSSLNEKLSELDKQSKELLGISLQALQFLLGDNPCTLHADNVLDRYDRKKYLYELKEAGIADVRSFQHRPKRSDVELELFEIRLREKSDYDDCE